jgi:hypothetical protein
MSKALVQLPKTDLEAVERFLTKADIVLSADQEELLKRLVFVDEKLRSRKHLREEIINLCKTRFGVSEYRAERDISDAQRLWGKTRKTSKQYVINGHIEQIERQIQMAMDARRLDLLPKLNDNLTYALNSLPEEKDERDQPTVKIILVTSSPTKTDDRTIDDLISEANQLLEDNNNEYIDYEEE